ncbi:ABC-type thiamine/hydroxymethylpyrimidine transport system permease subunit [Kroppenstedtia sanguinis]|uniref:YndM family protein n=1 Tax=Kroppenstedtia sanguinis TaxID=1380684 RepID=UPI0036D3B2BC
MRYLKALLIKFAMTFVILWLVLASFRVISFPSVFTASIVLTVVSFLIGDLLILPRFGNVVATMADLALTWFGIWVLAPILLGAFAPLGAASFMSAFFIAMGEILFHKYMKNQVFMDSAQVADEQ